jgi:tetratricopeptide (TPR) repeat protein
MKIWSDEIRELEKIGPTLESQYPELGKELDLLIRTDDANVILLYSRRCLEIIVTDLCESELKRPRKTEPLKGIIDKLNSEEKIPHFLVASMHSLNSLATFGVHPKAFEEEQIKPVLVNLNIILKWFVKYKESVSDGEKPDREKSTQIFQDDLARPNKKQKLRKIPLKTASGLIGTILFIVVIIILYDFIRENIFGKLNDSDDRISVTVMPFQNKTNDATWDVWQEGIQDNLVTILSNTEELRVRQPESTNELIQSSGLINYASLTPSLASVISKKLDATLVLYGNINKSGSEIRLNAQLIDPGTEEIIQSFQVKSPFNEDFIFDVIDSLSLKVKNFLVIKGLNKELPPDYQNKSNTSSPEAYKYFIMGQKAFNVQDYATAREMFSQAIRIDTNYTFATLMLSFAYANVGYYDQAKQLCLKAYEKREQLPMMQKIHADWAYAFYFETPNEEIKHLNRLMEFDDQFPPLYYELGRVHNKLYQYDMSIPLFERALKIYDKWDVEPRWANNYLILGYAYHETGQYKKEKKLYTKAEQDFPDDIWLSYWQAVVEFKLGNNDVANKYIDKFKTLLKNSPYAPLEGDITTRVAFIYWHADMLEKAEETFRATLAMQPNNTSFLNNLAYFLIDTERDVEEGLELIDRALERIPDSYIYLGNKGMALYKMGRYEEALELLEKSRNMTPVYSHDNFLIIEKTKKALAGGKEI